MIYNAINPEILKHNIKYHSPHHPKMIDEKLQYAPVCSSAVQKKRLSIDCLGVLKNLKFAKSS